MHQDATCYIVLDGDLAHRPLPPKRCTAAPPPHFSAHVYFSQTAGWIRIPLGREVGFGSGNIVFDGDPAPPHRKGLSSPHFSAIFVVANTGNRPSQLLLSSCTAITQVNLC